MSDKIQKIEQILNQEIPKLKKMRDIVGNTEGWQFVARQSITSQTIASKKEEVTTE